MAIRRTGSNNTTTTTPTPGGPDPQKVQQDVDALKKGLGDALTGGGNQSNLSDTEARGLIRQAEAGGPEVVAAFKGILDDALRTREVDGKPVTMAEATEKLLADFAGVNLAEVKLKVPEALGDDQRTEVAQKAAEKLIGVVSGFKDVEGTGQEAAAKGDPRVTERRTALGTLLANRAGGIGYKAALGALGDNVQTDIKWLMAADRTDYTLDGSNQFAWAQSNMSRASDIQSEFKSRVTKQQTMATGIDDGTSKVFDATSTSVVGLSMIQDTDKRANALVDTLLQFRARGDEATSQQTGGYQAQTRADKIAPALVAEQRILLAAADLDTTDASKVREYALLREVIASHPSSSVNGIFEARNAVGKIFMSGTTDYSGKDHATAWIKEEVPPGATFSAYKSIHHNFSRDTPRNIQAVFDQWVFPLGPSERRAQVFLSLADAQELADKGGDVAVARKFLDKQLTQADKTTLKDFLPRLKDAPDADFAATIRRFLEETAAKPLATDAHTVFERLLKAANEGTDYKLTSAINGVDDSLKTALEPLLTQLKEPTSQEKQERIKAFKTKMEAAGSLDDADKAILDKLASSATSSYSFKNALKEVTDAQRDKFKELLIDQGVDVPMSEKAKIIEKFAEDNKDTRFPDGPLKENVDYFARLYRSVCADQPSATSLEAELFHAGAAWKDVADVIAQMRAGNDLGTLKDLGEARLAMRDAIMGSDKGYQRHEMIKFDADLSRLTNTELGAAVDRVGELKTDGQKAEALLAVQAALRSAVASGLHELKHADDPASTKGEPLDVLLAEVTKTLDSGKIDSAEYRHLMAGVYVSVARTVQNIRAFVDGRAPDVAAMGTELDPEFLDQFVKQSPLHYATALSEKGMRAGLKEEIGPRCVKNVEGMRVLNSVGPVVFDSLYLAENTKELVDLKPEKDAMSVLFTLEEKKMVAVGGLIVDTEHAPGGNSHLNMYAMNNGITVLALPELRKNYAELFENAKTEGGLYVDDSNGEFQMMTVKYAIEQGLIKAGDVDNLRPGFNRKISYLESKGVGDGFDKIGYHEALVSPDRPTREIELFVAMDEVDGIGRKCTSFSDLAKLGIHARHLAGEKGTVLALLKSNPKLADSVPDGSMVTTGRCRKLLEDASILDEWDSIWNGDPDVGTVDDTNFLKSKFYTDPDYRADKRQWLQDLTKSRLTDFLLLPPKNDQLPADMVKAQLDKIKADKPDLPAAEAQHKAEEKVTNTIKHMDNELKRFDGAWPYETAELNPGHKSVKGDAAFKKQIEEQFGRSVDEMRKLVDAHAPTLTDEGKALYDELRDNPAMADSDNWIARSSFTGEDRPGKSGAGQYESFYHLKDPVSRIDGIIGVMESTWMPEPVENNVADEVNLQHIMPAVVMMHCLQPSESGVMISRDIEHGTRGQVYYQLVKGFGGGVEGGKTEEGTITASGHRKQIDHPDAPDGLVPAADLKKLREIVLETENYFNDVVEEGKGHAVDMEVARVDGEWKVVQARVIQLDR